MDEQHKKPETPAISGLMLSRNDLLELHRRALERVRKMTPEEGFRSLIASGIYTPDGKLAKEYGG
jgi:hypothetical protein